MSAKTWETKLNRVIDSIALAGTVDGPIQQDLIWLVDSLCADHVQRHGFARRDAKLTEVGFVTRATDYRGSVWIEASEKGIGAILGLSHDDVLTVYNPNGTGISEKPFSKALIYHYAGDSGGYINMLEDIFIERFKEQLRRLSPARIDLGRTVNYSGDLRPAAVLAYVVLDRVANKRAERVKATARKLDDEYGLPLLPLAEEPTILQDIKRK